MPITKKIEKTSRPSDSTEGPHKGCTRWNSAGVCTCPESKKERHPDADV